MDKHLLSLLLNECDSSSSNSDDSLEDLIENALDDNDDEDLILWAAEKTKTNFRNCITNYLDQVVPTYSEIEFKTHFRINRELFITLCEKLEGHPVYLSLRADKRITAAKHLHLFLWFAGHEAVSFRDLADRFDLSLSTVSSIIKRVTMFISSLSKEIIRWPNDDRKQNSADYFKGYRGFPRVIGAIDGTHITIDPPKKGKDSYIDRKGNISLCLQGVADEHAKFIDVFIGFPGSVHDSRVFKESFIYPNLKELCGNYYLLGDSAYPCLENLITPFKDNGHLSKAQNKFNGKLSSCRVVVEHSFGILKQRFRQLYYCKLRGMKKICHFVRACCVLHNLCSNSDFDDFQLDDETAALSNLEDIIMQNDSMLGKIERDRILTEMRNLL